MKGNPPYYKKKIVFIRTASSIGGAEITTKTVSEKLSKYFQLYNYQYPYGLKTLYTKQIKGKTLLEPGGGIKDYIKFHLLYLIYRSEYIKLANKITKENIDTVIIESFSDKIILTKIIHKISPRIKILWWEHGPMTRTKWLRYSPHLKYLYSKNLNYVNKIIVISKATQDDLSRMNVPIQKTRLIYPITEIENPSKQKTTENKKFTIGFTSRIEKEKGIYELLQATKILQKTPINFIIAGKGRESNKVQLYINNNKLQKTVHFVGFQKDISHILQKVDAVILPSDHEGLGLTLIEALKMGIPIIGTNTGGIPEILKNGYNGILIEKDPKDISDKIYNLYINKSLYKKLQANTIKSIKNFDSKNIIQKWKSIL
jgi:glycosyltransferase involved in cell wall biosynthesis